MTECKRIHMRTGIANEITREFWNNSGTVVQRICYNKKHNAIKIKYEKNEELINLLKYHLGDDSIVLAEENINPNQFGDDGMILNEKNYSYWIYTIDCINWEYLSRGI